MGALISTVWRGIMSITTWLGRNFAELWASGVEFMRFLAGWLVDFVSNGTAVVIEIVAGWLTYLVGLLPNMPTPVDPGSTSFLDQANRYLPLSETFALGSMWVVVFAGVGVYKLIKLIRGGG